MWRNFCFTLYLFQFFYSGFLASKWRLGLYCFYLYVVRFGLMKSTQVETETKPEIEDPEKKRKKEEKVCCDSI